MLAPLLRLDSWEQWLPVSVEDSLARLGYTWSHATWCTPDGPVSRLDFPDVMPEDFADLPVVGYHRMVPGGGLYWHQFWTWWVYNPKTYVGRGEHEGDWELVQLGCTDEAGEHPVLMTCAQHSGGEKREFWRVELSVGEPMAYIARDSHAAYFTTMRDVTDVADGTGALLAVSWREFGPWAHWTGQWGNSSNSPGPLSTRRAWSAPHAWHGQARG
jgi:hypothetical protein